MSNNKVNVSDYTLEQLRSLKKQLKKSKRAKFLDEIKTGRRCCVCRKAYNPDGFIYEGKRYRTCDKCLLRAKANYKKKKASGKCPLNLRQLSKHLLDIIDGELDKESELGVKILKEARERFYTKLESSGSDSEPSTASSSSSSASSSGCSSAIVSNSSSSSSSTSSSSE